MNGYIVVSRRKHGAFELCRTDDGPAGGILLHGVSATVFESRELALAAIRRTRSYEKRRGFDWQTWALWIQRLVPEIRPG